MKVEKNLIATYTDDQVPSSLLNGKTITRVISTATNIAPYALFIAALSNLPAVEAGPVSGTIAYWLSKTLFYKTAVDAGSAAITSAGGAAVIGIAAAATSAIGVSSTVTIVAKGVAGTIAAVESASAGVGLFFTSLPFLP